MFRPFSRTFEDVFIGWRFPVFTVSVLLYVTGLMAVMLVVPAGDGWFGQFAADFKTWCFDYDPATGEVNWTYAIIMILNPMMLVGIITGVWWEPLSAALSGSWHRIARVNAAAAIFVVGLAGGLVLLGGPEGPAPQLAFPAERLRTEMEPPDFDLVDQNGARVRLADLRGRVVVVTAVYATCHTACPMIITQAKRAIAKLTPEQREKLTVVAVTLDPVNDTQARRAAAARMHELEAPLFHFVNDEDDPEVVETLLDRLNVSRKVNPDTGEIEHSNLFVIIDRDTKIAYRLTLSDQHEHWLYNALLVLIREV